MPAKKINILLVEDNIDHAELVKRSFKKNRIPNVMHHVDDGEKALDYLLKDKTGIDYSIPDLILLDLRLPKVDGLEVLEEIKKHNHIKMIPVIILTSSASDKDIAGAYNSNANSYLVKPTDYSKFQKMMQELGVYWLEWNIQPH